MYERCLAYAESIRKITGGFTAQTAAILGSGLGGFTDGMKVEYSVDYKDIPGFPVSTVPGHRGRFVFGLLNGKAVAAAQGRLHCYEGYTPAEAVIPVRVFKLLGVKNVILTNAAGAVNSGFNTGELMLITDHIALFAESPLTGKNYGEFGVRFPDMSEVYSRDLINAALSAAGDLKITLRQGVYAQLKGPQYETPAEIRALSVLGADAVGMSTAIEAIAAKHAGMRVCGISSITNMAAGICGGHLSHEEVIKNSAAVQKDFCALLGALIERI